MTVKTISPSAPPLETVDLLPFCKATADPLRINILRVLSMESFGVTELARIFSVPQPGMSHHLKILTTADLLDARREGNSIFYRRSLISTDNPLGKLKQSLFEAIDQITLPMPVQAALSGVHQERAENSRLFFERNASKFKQNQDLIANFSQYSAGARELISNEQISEEATVMEVGPGDGDLLLYLSNLFAHVIALDNSAEMLDKARLSIAAGNRNNVRFLQGDLTGAVQQKIKVDLLVLNMVLHHAASPAGVFKQAYQLLNERGCFAVIDLCSHDQDWTREICGDIWLGFEPDDLDNWATNAYLSGGQSVYLGLRNGFQVQMRLFHTLSTTGTIQN
jgi:ubiquinone/menaquinone biosynthesis C-methylase UbiE/DNA-binding transcriptional ArsR family regulator